jgi:hypothetical protein
VIDTLRELGEAAVIPVALFLACWRWNRWVKHPRVRIPERIPSERVEPVDFGAAIYDYRVSKDEREWAATRPGRVA